MAAQHSTKQRHRKHPKWHQRVVREFRAFEWGRLNGSEHRTLTQFCIEQAEAHKAEAPGTSQRTIERIIERYRKSDWVKFLHENYQRFLTTVKG